MLMNHHAENDTAVGEARFLLCREGDPGKVIGNGDELMLARQNEPLRSKATNDIQVTSSMHKGLVGMAN